ncbi:MAG: DUF421 domain-containing protein [Actinomycetota bacterium]
MAVDWHGMFALGEAPLELVIRGSVVYWFLFLVFRTVLQRDVGAVGIADVLLLVIVADAAQNAMAAEYRSVTDGLILISTILGWNLLFDWAAWRFPRLRRLLQPREICLIRDGKMLVRNLRREFITEEELWAKLREHGITDLAEVQAAYMESDGAVSVIKRKETPAGQDDDDGDASPNRPI